MGHRPAIKLMILKTMLLLKRIPILSVMIWLTLSFKAQAQEPNFSMYHYTPFYTNPGRIGTVEDIRLMLNYRNQSIDVDRNFTSSSLSGYYPLKVDNHRFVLAGSFLNDQVSDFVTTNAVFLGAAYSISTSRLPNSVLVCKVAFLIDERAAISVLTINL